MPCKTRFEQHARLVLARPDAGDLKFAEAVGAQPRLRRVRLCRLGAQLDVHRVLRPLVAAAPAAAARGRQQTAQRKDGRLHLRAVVRIDSSRSAC